MDAHESLRKQGISGTCINARFVKPVDAGALKAILQKHCPAAPVITVEDGVAEAGFGSAIGEALGFNVERIGLPSQFIVHGKRQLLFEKYGLDAHGIAERIKKALKNNGKSPDR
jgi:1-deoxy-D-xylulose-5-phosphate synthase